MLNDPRIWGTHLKRREVVMASLEFVAAKSRVAPSKELPIHRLELQAAVIGSWLGSTILEELKSH